MKVLSTTRMAPALCASAATLAMSVTLSVGLVGVSSHTSFVCGLARRTRASSPGALKSTKSKVMP